MLITHFADHFATSKTERNYEPAELALLIARTTAQEKARLPWLKGARFGDVRSERGSLRHDLNVVQVTAIEGDYDGEAMEFDQAWERLGLLGVEAVLYTSPSHTPEKPRWRVVCPLSRPYPPAERAKFVGWINGLLGGVLADESFALSQSYYFGHLDGCAEFRVEHLRGTPLDELEELAQIAIGRRSTGNGPEPAGGAGPFNEAALIEQIVSGAAFHRSVIQLVGRWARDGLAMLATKARLEDAFDQVPEARRDTRWHNRRGPDLARILDYVYGKEAGKPPPDPPPTAPPDWRVTGLGPAWLNACQRTNEGHPIPNLANACLALRNDPHFLGRFAFDEMLRSPTDRGRAVEDADVELIHEWLQNHGLKRLGFDPVREAIDIVAREVLVHPLREWLHTLEWDHQPRRETWLTRYLGVEPSRHADAVGAMFLVQMVARIFEPGCQADYMLVLEGPQGELKSQALRTLTEPYFSDHLPEIGGDPIRLSAHLRGKWLIEVAELSAFNRAEAHALKSFITRQEEQYIPKYGRYEKREPRQCVFCGTTNDDAYLKDETGNRRFWPVKCGAIDLLALAQDREMLLAEAVHAFLHGTHWWPDRDFEREVIKPVQDARLWVDAWQAPLREYLDGQDENSQLTLMEIAKDALFIDRARFSQADQKRLATLMRHEGWERHRTTTTFIWRQFRK